MKNSVLFVEPPQYDADIDDDFLARRDLEKILVVDQHLHSRGMLNEKKLALYKSVYTADLGDPSSLENLSNAILRENKVAAVVGCSESSVLPAAWLAEKFRVCGIGIDVAGFCRNKFLMMEKLSAAGIPCPYSILANQASTALTIKDSIGSYPLICKPLMGFASFGVVRVDSDHALEKAIKQIARKSRFVMGHYHHLRDRETSSEVLVQSYIPGAEIAIEGYVQGGHSHVLAVIDKPHVSNGPYFEDRSHITPSRLDEKSLSKIGELVQSCIKALGLDNSTFHIEMRINDDQFYILEVGARPGLIHALRRSRGIDLVAVTLALKLGEKPPVEPRWYRYAGSVCISADRQGIFQGLAHLDNANKDPRIVEVRQFAKPGQRVAPPPDTTGYIAIVSITSDTYEYTLDAIKKASATIEVMID